MSQSALATKFKPQTRVSHFGNGNDHFEEFHLGATVSRDRGSLGSIEFALQASNAMALGPGGRNIRGLHCKLRDIAAASHSGRVALPTALRQLS